MKSFIAFAALFALAVASPLARTKPASNAQAELEAIVAAINSPSTDPATAALLEEQLAAIIAENSPISVGPAIVESELSPIAVGPEVIDFPVPDGGVVTAPAVIEPSPVVVPSPVIVPSPVVVGEIPAGSTPLVQIIVNVNQASTELSPIAVGPAIIDNIVEEPHVPGPVNVVDNVIAPEEILEPIQVVEPIVPGPVNVVDNVVVEPIQVVEPIVVEPVIVGTPIVPEPAVVLPDTLN